MPVYEFLISVVNEPGLYRKKAGDIIAVFPCPHHWGRKEIDRYLIVLVEMDLTYEEVCNFIFPSSEKKVHYSISLESLASVVGIQINKVNNPYYIYQPFKKKSFTEEKLMKYGIIVDAGEDEEKEIIVSYDTFLSLLVRK